MRRLLDVFATALTSLGEHKLRTALTMLGMMFGVGAVIAMLSIGAGAEHQALALIDRLGMRNVVIRNMPTGVKPEDAAEIRKKSRGLAQRDAEAIEDAVPGVAFAAPRIEIAAYKAAAAGAKTAAQIRGVGERHREVAPLALAEGRFVDTADQRHHAQVCVLGAAVRRALFGAGPALGKDVKLDDTWFEVIGVLAPDLGLDLGLGTGAGAAQGIAVASTDHEVYVPFTAALAKLDRDPSDPPLGEIVVRLQPGASAAAAGLMIGALLDRLHGGAHDYQIIVPEALLQHSERTQQLFNLVMGLIAGISLLVGGVGIMNIMLASVLEQTREIGVRRAVGARRLDIQFQFLVNAFVLALLGGALGVAIGDGIAHGVSVYAGWPTLVTLRSIALSLGVSITVGVLSGLYPARRASRLDPIEALAAA
jgi:putative ABC transport system permease protein